MTRERAPEGEGGAEVALPTTTASLDSNHAMASGDVGEVAHMLQAQPARRDAILRQLHQSRGNAFVGQVLAAVDNAASHEEGHQDQSRGGFEPDDDGADPAAGLLWQKQGGGSGGFSETKNSADTSKKVGARRIGVRRIVREHLRRWRAHGFEAGWMMAGGSDAITVGA
ncbi:MAG: hypothetical protein H0T46_24930 [Deltaproteobacteria bacterium]|nr:hypothetical protein [Deltaproteobacteria bacterium]